MILLLCYSSWCDPCPPAGAQFQEPLAFAGAPAVEAPWPLEQLHVTNDDTDYLWYTTPVPAGLVSSR